MGTILGSQRDPTFIFFFDFVSFKAWTIMNPIDEGEGCSERRYEGEIWKINLPYIRPHGNLATHIESCKGVEWTLLNENDDVFERSTDA
jgi:hypothetical protein